MAEWILVADGDAEARMELFRLLEADGYHATVVDSMKRALELLRSEPFDLALVDLTGRRLDGVGLLEAVRADPHLDHLPLLITTPVATATEIARYLEMGAQDYLLKPFQPPLVRSRVRAGLAMKRLQDIKSEYERLISHMIDAVGGIAGPAFDRSELEHMSGQSNPCGRLALALLKMASRVELHDQPQGDGITFGSLSPMTSDGSGQSAAISEKSSRS